MRTYSTGKSSAAHAAIAFILAMMIALVAGIGNVHAANVCSDVYGDCDSEKSFTVTTGDKWYSSQSVKVTQTKGTYKYEMLMLNGSKYKTKNQYATYYITVEDEHGNYVLDRAKWNGRSFNIKLSKNTSYDITIEPEKNYSYGVYIGDGWESDATWKVSRTKNCTFCESTDY